MSGERAAGSTGQPASAAGHATSAAAATAAAAASAAAAATAEGQALAAEAGGGGGGGRPLVPSLVWVDSAADALDAATARTTTGLVTACRTGLLHGPALLLCYAVAGVPAPAPAFPTKVEALRRAVGGLAAAATAAMGGAVAGELKVLASSTAACAATAAALGAAANDGETSDGHVVGSVTTGEAEEVASALSFVGSTADAAATRQPQVCSYSPSVKNVRLGMLTVLAAAPLASEAVDDKYDDGASPPCLPW